MPLYEYACDACRKRSTALLRRYDDPDPACPHCGSLGLRRLVSTFATSRPDAGDGDFGDDLGEDGYGDEGGYDDGYGDDGGGDFDDDF